jgi:DNA-binding response OmpR family regulator
MDELVPRLRALLRRSGADRATTLGGLCLDPVTHAITDDELDPDVARLRRKLYEVSARAAIETARDVRCRLG